MKHWGFVILLSLILLVGCTSEYEQHYELGKWYFDKGLLTDAAIEFKAATRADAENFRAHYGLAVVYVKKGWYEYALREAEAAFDLYPSDNNYQLIEVIRNKQSLDSLDVIAAP